MDELGPLKFPYERDNQLKDADVKAIIKYERENHMQTPVPPQQDFGLRLSADENLAESIDISSLVKVASDPKHSVKAGWFQEAVSYVREDYQAWRKKDDGGKDQKEDHKSQHPGTSPGSTSGGQPGKKSDTTQAVGQLASVPKAKSSMDETDTPSRNTSKDGKPRDPSTRGSASKIMGRADSQSSTDSRAPLLSRAENHSRQRPDDSLSRSTSILSMQSLSEQSPRGSDERSRKRSNRDTKARSSRSRDSDGR